MRLVWLAQARADRRAIHDRVEAENPVAAIEVDEHIRDRATHLIDHPRIGRRGRVAGTHELILARYEYLLVYRRANNIIEILRVLHQREQWPKQ